MALWVAVSNHFKVWNLNIEPDVVISNPLLLSKIDEMVQNKVENSIKRIVYIGRLSEEKQPDWVLDIAQKCNLPLVVIGDGNLRNPLELKSSNLNIDVDFKGFVRQPWKLMSHGDLLVVPSQYEGDGLVVVEAIARRIPILLNDIPDLLRFDLPTHHYCLKVSDYVSRIDEYKSAIGKLVVSEKLRNDILLDRDPTEIAKKWVLLLSDQVNQ
jgi:glycosyltransferase involved in cell wall biosynthesis